MHVANQHFRDKRGLPYPSLLKLNKPCNSNQLKGKPNILSKDTVSMPSVVTRVKELKRKFYESAPAQNQPKIEKALSMYKDKANVNFTVVQNMVLALYSPTLMGKKNVDKMYENFLSKYGDEEAFPWTTPGA